MSAIDRLRRLLSADDRSAGQTRPAGERTPAIDAPDARRLHAQLRDVERLLRDQQKAIVGLERQLSMLRGLQYQQMDVTTDALHRAGMEDADAAALQRSLTRALRIGETGKDVIVGPWTGEVGFELMYWIPFLTWLTSQGIGGDRMVVVSRGGAAPWYRHLTSRYVDILDLVSPDEFRTRTAGPKKQRSVGDFDTEILDRVKASHNLVDPEILHPSVMYRLFLSLWRRRASVSLLDDFTTYRALSNDRPVAVPDLPRDYVVAKFYFSKAFPESAKNRAFAGEVLRTVSRQAPVVLLATGVRLDEHEDFHGVDGLDVTVVDPHTAPQKNLEVQTDIIRGSRGFVGTYGGFSYLAPFYGVPSLSFFSDRTRFESHHLDLAYRVFTGETHGRFIALDRRDFDIVQPAVDRWAAASASTP